MHLNDTVEYISLFSSYLEEAYFYQVQGKLLGLESSLCSSMYFLEAQRQLYLYNKGKCVQETFECLECGGFLLFEFLHSVPVGVLRLKRR